MTDTTPTRNSPGGQALHAGRRLFDVVTDPGELASVLQQEPVEGSTYRVIQRDGAYYKVVPVRYQEKIVSDAAPGAAAFENHTDYYLIPHYLLSSKERRGFESGETHNAEHIKRHKLELLNDRVQRFFYSVPLGLDARVSKEQLESEYASFQARHQEICEKAEVRKAAALEKLDEEIQKAPEDEVEALSKRREALAAAPAFSINTPYELMNSDERRLVSDGAVLVGYMINRLGRLGAVILQGNDERVIIEPSGPYDHEQLVAFAQEFKHIYSNLVIGENHDMLVRCVLTRHNRVDHDGVINYFAHEIGKVLIEDLHQLTNGQSSSLKRNSESAEGETRDGIVRFIGNTVHAIDETYTALKTIFEQRSFKKLLEDRVDRDGFGFHEVNLNEYIQTFERYVGLARARTCIRSEDYENYPAVHKEFRELHSHLHIANQKIAEIAAHGVTADKRVATAAPLLKRGLALIHDMAEMRLPRNQNCPYKYYQDVAELRTATQAAWAA